MTCREFSESLEELADPDVTPDQSSDLRAHAASCPPCATRLAEAEALNQRLRGLRESYRPPARLLERVRDAIRDAAGPGAGSRAAPRLRPGQETRSHAWIRLWRWAPAAVAALLVSAVVVLFFAGPGPAVPSLIADTVSAYEGLTDGSRPLDIDSRDPRAVRDYFRKRLNAWLPAPGAVGAGAFTLRGGCACAEAASGTQIPCAVYDRGGTLLALLAVDHARLDRSVLDRAERSLCRGKAVYYFVHRGVCVLVCPSAGSAAHVWVSRLPPGELCAAVEATAEGRLALHGVRIAIEDLTCEMCCSGVREALAGVHGVQEVGFDVDGGEARVVLASPEIPVAALLEALARAGYRARPVADKE